MRTIPHWIDGEAVSGGDTVDVLNPATDKAVASVPMADPATVNRALETAAAAAAGWAATSLSRRVQPLYRLRDLLLEHRSELAALISEEHGKTVDDAAGEVGRAVEAVELACGGPALSHGSTSLQTGPGINTKSVMHPLGVVVGITPFNFPVMIGLMQGAVAIAAGNAFVWKPSEQAPGVAVRVAELFAEAGLPAGVLTVIHGRQETSEALIDSPITQAVAFVGSTPVAHSVYKRASASVFHGGLEVWSWK